MKKSLFVMVCVLIISIIFTSCKKEGIYNPQKKIKRIYTEEDGHLETYDQNTGTWEIHEEWSHAKQPVEVWEWDGKLLKSITNYYNQEFYCKTFFFYDKKRLDKVVISFDANNSDENSPECWQYFRYSYDKGKLSSIKGYNAEGEASLDISVTHSGSHISRVTLKGTIENLHEKNSENLISLVCSRIVFPFMGINIPKPPVKYDKSKREYWFVYDYELEWMGDNIKKVILNVSDSEDGNGGIIITDYSYDDKLNPYYGSFLSYEAGDPESYRGYIMPTSKNNLVFEAEDNWYQSEYTYTYVGEYPLTQTKRTIYTYNNEEERNYNNTTTYFEYE